METLDGIEEVEIRCWNCTCKVGKKLLTGKIFCKQCLVLVISTGGIFRKEDMHNG